MEGGESKGKMRFGFKKLVRAVSPLIRSISSSRQRPPSVVDENDAYSYDWDLSNVDLKTALKLFYRQYNPEKSFIVGEIVQKYAGDEILLLQQLCERYNLSEAEMQEYLDQAPSKVWRAKVDKNKNLIFSRIYFKFFIFSFLSKKDFDEKSSDLMKGHPPLLPFYRNRQSD